MSCTAPQTLVDGVCTDPAPAPESTGSGAQWQLAFWVLFVIFCMWIAYFIYSRWSAANEAKKESYKEGGEADAEKEDHFYRV